MNAIKQGLKLCLVQLPVGPNKSQNIAEAVKNIYEARNRSAQLVALPECFNTPYGIENFKDYAEEIPNGETSMALSQAAIETGTCIVGGTIPELFGDRIYNTSTVWDSCGRLVALHRKIHLYDVDIPKKLKHKESDVVSPGNDITMFEHCGVRIGLGINYDIRFPELSHIMAKQGCSLLIYPAAFDMTTGPLHYELLARSRANDHQLWVALVSPARDTSVPCDKVIWGHSTLIDPWAQTVAKLDDKPGLVVCNIDLQTMADVRKEIPITEHRRTDIYDTVIRCSLLNN